MKKTNLFLVLLFLPTILNSYTNKTYIRPIDSSFYMPEKNTFMDFVSKQNGRPDLRASIDMSFFYFQSRDEQDLGRYFGVNEKNNVVIGRRGPDNPETDVEALFLVNEHATETATIIFEPKSMHTGCALSMIYDCSDWVNNLVFKIHIPFVKTENDLRMQSSGNDFFRQYLTGEFENTNNNALQAKLENAKITDKQSETGFSDIDLSVVYKIYTKKKLKSFLGASLIIPASNKPSGEFVFEPITGNNSHWGFGLSKQTIIDIYERDEFELGFFFDVDYKYLFSNTQKRTLAPKGTSWGQYFLLGKASADSGQPLIPAANVLTRDVKVEPGSAFSADVRFLLSFENVYAKIGYKFLFAEEEQVSLKGAFPQDLYGIAGGHDTENAFAVDGGSISEIIIHKAWLSNKTIDTTVAATPYVLSNQIYTQIGYDYRSDSRDTVASFDIGGSYIFSSENSSFTGWSVWFKTELSF